MEWTKINSPKDLPKDEKIIVWVKEGSVMRRYAPWHEVIHHNGNWICEAGLSTISVSDITHYSKIEAPKD